jgi:hypothetical protein
MGVGGGFYVVFYSFYHNWLQPLHCKSYEASVAPQINTGDRKGDFDEILKYSFVCHVILYDTLKSEDKV